ncbi:MAG: TetR family transcriptional regulator [Parasphingorhabdus sp.]|nr:TetR family transcriptional regulator [Parasphingorhabdus sp.]
MARPETDIKAVRQQLLIVADEMVRARGAVDFTMTDLARAADMSPSNVYRFFENKDALAEAMAGMWFAELIEIMEEVVASDLEPRAKLYEFFRRRLAIKQARYDADPALFTSYMDLGELYFDVIRGYVDLADHFMASILAEAMEAGYFPGLSLDRLMSLTNLMLQPFCNPRVMRMMSGSLDETKLAQIIDAIFDGLKATKVDENTLSLVS